MKFSHTLTVTTKSGRDVTVLFGDIPWWKWVQAKLGIGWIRSSRRTLLNLVYDATDEQLDSIQGWNFVRTAEGKYERKVTP